MLTKKQKKRLNKIHAILTDLLYDFYYDAELDTTEARDIRIERIEKAIKQIDKISEGK